MVSIFAEVKTICFSRNPGFTDAQNILIPECRIARFPEYQNPRIPDFQNAEFRIPEFQSLLKTLNFANSESRES